MSKPVEFKQAPNMKERFNKLPDYCYVVTPMGSVSEVKVGITGHWPRPWVTVQEAMKMNESMGVTPAQEEAMLTGSIFGWDIPGSDPDSYIEVLDKLMAMRYERLQNKDNKEVLP